MARSRLEQVREWCAQPDAVITVQPVIDLAEHLHVGSYEASARLKLQTQLRDLICAFPYCFRPAEKCDCDHRVPHDDDDDGPTCSCNLTPACRGHHRAKTTGGWTYLTVEPGVYLWRSPLGYEYLKDPTGTLDVTPTEERRKLAREFRHHFGDTRPTTPNPDHPAPHPARHHASGGIGAPRRPHLGALRGWSYSQPAFGSSAPAGARRNEARCPSSPWNSPRRCPTTTNRPEVSFSPQPGGGL